MLLLVISAGLLAAIACRNTSGLSERPRATFSMIACLDNNGDNVLNRADADDRARVPDFNADRKHDERDSAFLEDLNIPLNAAWDKTICEGKSKEPEYLVAHGFLNPAEVSCADADDRAVLLVGVGGGVVNLKDPTDAAGIRKIIDGLLGEYDDRNVQAIGVLAGPAIGGAQQIHSAMEEWLSNAARVYLDRYPCMSVVFVGHSHGAVTVDVVASRLEGKYADRIMAVVDIDRVESLYTGDITSLPSRVPVYNVYETADGRGHGVPINQPNYENVDATNQQGPEHGEQGGALKPVNHTTIDNSRSVREMIIGHVTGLELTAQR